MKTDEICANSYTLIRTWTATDDCGNETSFTQTVTVSDNTAPTFNETLPTVEITAECDAIVEAVVLTASDNCDTDVPVVFEEIKTDEICANSYTLIRTWTATDDCGNETSFTQTVTVSDNTAPEVTCNDITVQLDANGVATISVDDINAGTTDACSGIDTMFISQETFFCGNVGENVVTLTAIDECGNEATCTAIVTVEEGEADCGINPLRASADILEVVICPGNNILWNPNILSNDEGIGSSGVTITIDSIPSTLTIDLESGDLNFFTDNYEDFLLEIPYTICSNADPENCSSATITIIINLDTDCDGVPNYIDIDDDNDGLLDIHELDPTKSASVEDADIDTDGDGIVDRLDLDSDGDGVVDNVEWQQTINEAVDHEDYVGLDYYEPLGSDSDGDGWDDRYDDNGENIYYEAFDMDLDGIPDHLDSDTDGDGIEDIIDGNDANFDGIADVLPTGLDSDKDGIDDAYDTFDNWFVKKDKYRNTVSSNAALQDKDADLVRDWRDPVDDTPVPEQFACGEPIIPNGFSPNQDGYNDYFKVMIYCTGDQGGSEERVLGDDFDNARIEIFNRWGNLVYEQERYGNEEYWGDVDAWWDGRSMHDMQVGNDQLPTATYYFILYFNDGSKEPITGFVFLNN
ncbi:T9SS type B sorting domain-containing protein [Draconibacterium sediminis]